MSDVATKKSVPHQRHGFLTVAFDEIEEPGVYVNQRGDMFRIPPDGLAEGRSPLIAWECDEGNLVTRISENPYTPISKCRQLAADADLPVRF